MNGRNCSVSAISPKRRYVRSMPEISAAGMDSLNFCVRKLRTSSFDRRSTLGGVLKVRPTAFSIFGTASLTSLA